jgi:cobaltochelatase CobS
MEKNDILEEIINQVRKDIIRNKDFIKSILADYQVTNIDPNTILTLMALTSSQQELRRPNSNAPKEKVKGKKAIAKPIPVAENSIPAKIVSDLLEGNNVYLLGKAGTGKTYMAEAIAESVLGQPYYMINCSQWTSPIEIRGGQTIEGYQEGLLIEAWAKGGVLILDELPKLDHNTAGLLNAALAEAAKQPKYDENGQVIEDTIPTITNGKGIKIKKGQWAKDDELRFRFCVIATGNTNMMNVGNKYAGNNKQDYSLVDRFAGSFYFLEQNLDQEKKLTYPYVFHVCNAIRQFLIEEDA